jgi:hypothetical protein
MGQQVTELLKRVKTWSAADERRSTRSKANGLSAFITFIGG